MALGIPYNIAGYAFLLHLIGRFTGLRPWLFGHTIIDSHIYTAKADGSMAKYDHIPELLRQCRRPVKALPQLVIDSGIKTLEDLDSIAKECNTEQILDIFSMQNYNPHKPLKFKVAV